MNVTVHRVPWLIIVLTVTSSQQEEEDLQKVHLLDRWLLTHKGKRHLGLTLSHTHLHTAGCKRGPRGSRFPFSDLDRRVFFVLCLDFCGINLILVGNYRGKTFLLVGYQGGYISRLNFSKSLRFLGFLDFLVTYNLASHLPLYNFCRIKVWRLSRSLQDLKGHVTPLL